MNFDPSEEQERLRDSVREVLERECPPDLVRSIHEGGGPPAQPWQSARDLGWPALAIPEAYEGLGLGFVELSILAEEHGRQLCAGPLLATLSQFAPAVAEAADADQARRFLSPVAAGNCTGALAIWGSEADFDVPDASLIGRPEAGAWRLSGRRRFVLDGDRADELVLAAHVDRGDGVGLFVVPRERVKTSLPRATLDPSRPLAMVDVEDLRIEGDRTLGTPGESAPALARAVHWAVAALAFEMVGCAQRLFDLTVEYARHREQFGKPIGAFQATQHKLADLFVSLEKARASATFAAMTIAEDDPRRALASSMAKAAAGECQARVAKEAIQIHGGLGYTWEQDVHLYVKRLKTDEASFGTAGVHRQRIASGLGL